MRRKVSADRRSTRRSVQIVVLVSVGMAIALALLDHGFLIPYNGVLGQFPIIGDQLQSNVHSLKGSAGSLAYRVSGSARPHALQLRQSHQRLLGAWPQESAAAASRSPA